MCQSRPWRRKEEEPMEKKDIVVSVDIAKVVFDAAVSHEPGRIAQRQRLTRKAFLLFFAQMPAATVVMEACGSAHFWARKIEELGHRVVLLPPRCLVKCQRSSAGTVQGTGGAKIGNAYLKWAFSEAAVLFLAKCPEAKKLFARIERKHG